jgi:hypothetical protein
MKYHVLKHLKVNPFRKDTFHHLNYVDYIKQNFKKKKNSVTGPLQEEKTAVELKPAKEEEGRQIVLKNPLNYQYSALCVCRWKLEGGVLR